VLKKRENAGNTATYLAMVLAATTIYSMAYAMELASDTLPGILFWVKIEHIGIEMIAPFWLLFTLAITGRNKYITPLRTAVLFIIPVIVLLSTFLGKYHLNPQLTADAPFPTLTYQRGFFAWLGIGYLSLFLVTSFILLISMYLNSLPAFRKQALILLFSAALPFVGMIISTLHLAPYNLDLAPLSMSISGILFLVAFQRLQFLDIIPLARDIIFEGMGDGILVLDNYDRLVDHNPSLQKIFSHINLQIIGQPFQKVFEQYPDLIRMVDDNSDDVIEIQVESDRGVFSYRCNLLSLSGPHNNPVGKIISFHDYTEVKLLIDQLSDLATIDNLTGIYNRRYFCELAQKEISRAERYHQFLSLIIFDLDFFKQINDTYGHAAGDAVLAKVVGIFDQRLRSYDIMGRFGGDEFLILLPETNLEDAAALAEELRFTLEHSEIVFEEHTFHIKASFGVTGMLVMTTITLEEMIRCVDGAMYKAKQEGRNRIQICTPATKGSPAGSSHHESISLK
jgi:diguanylate cyclase (GGDEF)-like protein